MKEDDLIVLINQNNQAAFYKIYDQYWEQLFLFVVKVIKNEDEAKDIVQDIFVSLWLRREELKNIKSLSAYLFTAARYKGLTYIQKNSNKNNYSESLSTFLTEHNYSEDQYQSAREMEAVIDERVKTLPSKMQVVFSLSRTEGLSHKQISEKLGISDKTVKKQINNALKQIRTVLSNKYGAGLLIMSIIKFFNS